MRPKRRCVARIRALRADGQNPTHRVSRRPWTTPIADILCTQDPPVSQRTQETCGGGVDPPSKCEPFFLQRPKPDHGPRRQACGNKCARSSRQRQAWLSQRSSRTLLLHVRCRSVRMRALCASDAAGVGCICGACRDALVTTPRTHTHVIVPRMTMHRRRDCDGRWAAGARGVGRGAVYRGAPLCGRQRRCVAAAAARRDRGSAASNSGVGGHGPRRPCGSGATVPEKRERALSLPMCVAHSWGPSA